MTQEQIYKYLRGETTQAERQKILQWINESPGNMATFRTLRNVYDSVLCGEGDLHLSRKAVNGRSHSHIRTKIYKLVGVAASVCAAFVCGAMLMWDAEVQTTSVVSTVMSPAGQRTELTLADGTHVWLGPSSSLQTSTAWGTDTRSVTLQGEAYFTVTKNSGAPFVVNTAGRSVTVYGTKFNVSAYNDAPEMRVKLYEGSVSVTDSLLARTVALLPGQEAIASPAGLIVESFHTSGGAPLWIHGIYSFHNSTYAEILTEMSNVYNVTLTLNGNWVDTQRCTCKFYESDGLENMLNSLQHIRPFTYRWDQDSRRLVIE